MLCPRATRRLSFLLNADRYAATISFDGRNNVQLTLPPDATSVVSFDSDRAVQTIPPPSEATGTCVYGNNGDQTGLHADEASVSCASDRVVRTSLPPVTRGRIVSP